MIFCFIQNTALSQSQPARIGFFVANRVLSGPFHQLLYLSRVLFHCLILYIFVKTVVGCLFYSRLVQKKSAKFTHVKSNRHSVMFICCSYYSVVKQSFVVDCTMFVVCNAGCKGPVGRLYHIIHYFRPFCMFCVNTLQQQLTG